jgi:RND superfamily putative drug exporter
MFQHLGNFVTRAWAFLLAFWVIVLVAVTVYAPPWSSVAAEGAFSFLPDDAPSRLGEQLFARAFPHDQHSSNVVFVVFDRAQEHDQSDQQLTFINTVLRPRLDDVVDQLGGYVGGEQEGDQQHSLTHPVAAHGPPLVASVRTPSDPLIGRLLRSHGHEASLVMVDLVTDFGDFHNWNVVARMEKMLESIREEGLVPDGLDVKLTGSAVLGRDFIRAEGQSASATRNFTILLVVVLLVIIYRAPLLAMIPLLTLYFSVEIAIKGLSLAAQAGWIGLFEGVQVYVTVLAYGAGVDYCLFLTARYKEELDAGAGFEQAIANAIGRVGAAVTASAGTVICGISMLAFAAFGKFHEAGVSIAASLLVVLLASLTLSTSLLRMTGRWAFWPERLVESSQPGEVKHRSRRWLDRFVEHNLLPNIWERVGNVLLRWPGWIWLGCIVVMIPFTIVGILNYDNLSYGMLSELPADAPSAAGTAMLERYFPAGTVGPITVLAKSDQVDFRQRNGVDLVGRWTGKLRDHRDQLEIADIRSIANPLGFTVLASDTQSTRSITARAVVERRAMSYYVSQAAKLAGHVTRFDIVSQLDPFSRDAIENINAVRAAVEADRPAELSHAQVFLVGPTASLRDLKTYADEDRTRINFLVTTCVFAILIVLLRRVAVPLYLVASVLLSYLVTLGVTFVVFEVIEGPAFVGLDWKVPIFLFTILIAVGEDYNIFLMTRVHEEQRVHGPVKGITEALHRTGRIISSCGFIMAGTFASLAAGSLTGMRQLGFALAFGVLLDTFLVRPILIPAWLVLLNSQRFGRLSHWLGAESINDTSPLTPDPSPTKGEGRIGL